MEFKVFNCHSVKILKKMNDTFFRCCSRGGLHHESLSYTNKLFLSMIFSKSFLARSKCSDCNLYPQFLCGFPLNSFSVFIPFFLCVWIHFFGDVLFKNNHHPKHISFDSSTIFSLSFFLSSFSLCVLPFDIHRVQGPFFLIQVTHILIAFIYCDSRSKYFQIILNDIHRCDTLDKQKKRNMEKNKNVSMFLCFSSRQNIKHGQKEAQKVNTCVFYLCRSEFDVFSTSFCSFVIGFISMEFYLSNHFNQPRKLTFLLIEHIHKYAKIKSIMSINV